MSWVTNDCWGPEFGKNRKARKNHEWEEISLKRSFSQTKQKSFRMLLQQLIFVLFCLHRTCAYVHNIGHPAAAIKQQPTPLRQKRKIYVRLFVQCSRIFHFKKKYSATAMTIDLPPPKKWEGMWRLPKTGAEPSPSGNSMTTNTAEAAVATTTSTKEEEEERWKSWKCALSPAFYSGLLYLLKQNI